jgi:hypothetical protein
MENARLSLMDIENRIIAIAESMLANDTEPIIKYKLLRYVLNVDSSEIEDYLEQANENNKWIQLLQKEQWKDGSWGRLHSRDTKRKQQIYTTEVGVRKSILLGLDKGHPIVQNALKYLTENISEGMCRDPPEKNDRWPIGVKLFFASTLALIDSSLVLLDPIFDPWIQILEKTFGSGNYSLEKEKLSHIDIFGLKDELKFLHLNSKYHLELFSSRPSRISKKTIHSYLDWLWRSKSRIRYLGVDLADYQNLPQNNLYSWLDALMIILKFNYRGRHSYSAIEWLWNQRNDQDLWDFGLVNGNYYKLSSNWRKKNRIYDCSTLVLCSLAEFFSPNK